MGSRQCIFLQLKNFSLTLCLDCHQQLLIYIYPILFFLHCLRVTTAHVQREGGDLPQRVDGARVSAGAGGERGSL